MDRMGTRWWIAAGWLLALLFAVPAQASGFPTGRPVTLCFSRATMTAADAFAHPERFDCRTPQTALPPGDYWVLSQPLPAASARTPLAVRSASLWQADATLYARYADGHVAVMRLDEHTLTRRMQIGAIVEQPLPTRAAAPVRLLWHITAATNARGIVAGAHLATHADSARANLVLGAAYAGFAGLCLALLVYNLALWAALRHRFQIAYCSMMAALFVYAFSSSGALAWACPAIANNNRMRINYLALAVAASTALLFARSFFEPEVFRGRLGRATTVVVGAVLGSAALFVLLAPWQFLLLDRLYSISFLAELALVPAILWRAWTTRSNYLWAFALAWAAPIALACARVANTFHLVGWSFWLDNSTLVAMTVEALLSSIGIAYRLRVLAAERDEARGAEIAARLLADTDPLTGLLNRRAFLQQAIGREGEQQLILADIDHFKHVNETLGHDGGDEVLRMVARALHEAVPAGVLVARIGGEEFAILALAALALDPADLLAQVRAARMPYDLVVTVSLGLCTGTLAREMDWKALYREADRALFAAKAAGRDRARRAQAPEPLAIAA